MSHYRLDQIIEGSWNLLLFHTTTIGQQVQRIAIMILLI